MRPCGKPVQMITLSNTDGTKFANDVAGYIENGFEIESSGMTGNPWNGLVWYAILLKY